MNMLRLVVLTVAGLVLSGCANMNYNNRLTSISNGILTGDIQSSLAMLEESAGGPDKEPAPSDKPQDPAAKPAPNARKDLLFHMEAGQLKRLGGNTAGSTASWLLADEFVRAWEEELKRDPGKLLGNLASVTLNDTLRTYEGRDYEKVMLNVGLALNHIAVNDWDKARVEIRKMHERQALIADYQSKVIEKAKEEAAGKKLKVTSFKELGGYPIETLEDPEVQKLANSYESAFGHYLAGYVYESLGDTSLAAAGYRKAAEMRPNVPLIEAALRELDRRTAPPVVRQVAPVVPVAPAARTPRGRQPPARANSKAPAPPPPPVAAAPAPAPVDNNSLLVDTLIVAEMGLAPAVETQKIALLLPIPCRSGLCPQMVALSWPVVRPVTSSYPGSVRINDQDVPLTFMTSINTMSRRAIYDEMPAIMARTSIRAIAKVVAQQAVDESTSRAGAALGPFGGLISLATKVAVAATEVADERVWRTLPDSYHIARVMLPPGKHKMSVNIGGIIRQYEFTVAGKYAVTAMRVTGNQLYALSPASVVTTFNPNPSPGGVNAVARTGLEAVK